jgi:hypothetical protein
MNAAFTRGLFLRMAHTSLIPQASNGPRQVTVTIPGTHPG